MRARYLGANADLMKVRGSRHDTGEVLQMALGLGCKASGHWQGAHATPIDANFPDVELSNKANRYGYTFGITVNSLGQRFFDEGEAHHLLYLCENRVGYFGRARRSHLSNIRSQRRRAVRQELL